MGDVQAETAALFVQPGEGAGTDPVPGDGEYSRGAMELGDTRENAIRGFRLLLRKAAERKYQQ